MRAKVSHKFNSQSIVFKILRKISLRSGHIKALWLEICYLINPSVILAVSKNLKQSISEKSFNKMAGYKREGDEVKQNAKKAKMEKQESQEEEFLWLTPR